MIVADAEILVPLTTSLYVPGKLATREKVIVDIGTGFYVEKVRFSPHYAPLSVRKWRMATMLIQ